MSKWMWIVAGPNGAGKSSFAGDFLISLGYWNLLKLNADERTIESLGVLFPAACGVKYMCEQICTQES